MISLRQTIALKQENSYLENPYNSKILTVKLENKRLEQLDRKIDFLTKPSAPDSLIDLVE